MNREERRAAATSTAAAVAAVNNTVADVGSAIRRRVGAGLAPLGGAGTVPLAMVEGHSRSVHAVVGLSARLVGAGVGAALAATADPDAPALDDQPGARATLVGLRAAFGDNLPAALAPDLVLVGDTKPCESIVVFVHGLWGHEDQWHADYRAAANDRGFANLSARFTSGLAIDESARQLARALDDLVRTWPVPPQRLVLVGHSMGGLVISEALHQSPSAPWVPLVSDVVTLGSPFLGAPLERAARTALGLAGRSSVVAPIVRLGDHRSVGIKDLGDGIHSAPEPMRHHAVFASLGQGPEALVSRLLGDGMVPIRSAHRPRGATSVTVHSISGAGHLHLLGHPGVTKVLIAVLEDGGQARARTTQSATA